MGLVGEFCLTLNIFFMLTNITLQMSKLGWWGKLVNVIIDYDYKS